MNDDFLSLAQAGFAALGDIAFACALAAVLFAAWLARDQAFATTASPARRACSRAMRTGAASAFVLTVSNFVSLWLQSAAMSGSPITQAGASLWLVATGTHVGIGWSVAFAGSVVPLLAAGGSAHRPMRAARFACAVFGALIAASGKAAIGHAADAGAFSLAEAVQTVHILATAVWGGIVIVGAALVLPALSGSVARASLIRTVGHMSRAAAIALAFVIATGVFNAWRGTGGSAAVLTASVWGQALLVKSAFVLIAIALGALNRWLALPRLARTAATMDAHTVINLMRIEAVAMIGVFVAASVLAHSMPGMAM